VSLELLPGDGLLGLTCGLGQAGKVLTWLVLPVRRNERDAVPLVLEHAEDQEALVLALILRVGKQALSSGQS